MKAAFFRAFVFFGMLFVPMAGLFAFIFSISTPPIEVSVTDFGAVAGDGLSDHLAFQAALEAVAANGSGTVLVPPGTYDFDARRTIDLKNASVSLIGCGKGVTVLRCRNSTGIWWFSNSLDSNQLSISDLTLVAGASGSAGTAIQINNPSLTSNTDICSLHMERIGFEPEVPGTDFFYRHIFTTYLMNSEFIDVFVTTRGMRESSESGFRINYGSGAYFENCYSKGNGTGWVLTNFKGAVGFNRCNAVDNVTGFKTTALAAENCTVAVLGVHVNTLDTNLEIYRADQVTIENAASYTSATNAFTDFYLEDCTDVDIVGCEFHQPYTAVRTMVHLAGATSDVLIKYNIFNGKTTDPNGNGQITDVLVESGVSNVTQQDNLSPLTHQW
jgi:hypothetical protein